LSLGLPRPADRSFAHQLLARYYLERNQPQEALNHVNQAAISAERSASLNANLAFLRGQAYRRLGQYDLAYQEIQQAIAQAQAAGREEMARFYQKELTVVEKHAGRPLGPPVEGESWLTPGASEIQQGR